MIVINRSLELCSLVFIINYRLHTCHFLVQTTAAKKAALESVMLSDLFLGYWNKYSYSTRDFFAVIIKNLVTYLIGKRGNLTEQRRIRCLFYLSKYWLSRRFEFLRQLFRLWQLQLMRQHSNSGGENHMTQLWFIQDL